MVFIEIDPEDRSKGYARAEHVGPKIIITAYAKPPAKLKRWIVNGESIPGGKGHYAISFPFLHPEEINVKAVFR